MSGFGLTPPVQHVERVYYQQMGVADKVVMQNK
jgi:hypothetical protein